MLHPWTLVSALRRPARLLDRVTSAHHKYLDHVCAALTHHPLFFPQGFFSDGWGDVHIPSILEKRVQDKDKYYIHPIESLELTMLPPPRQRKSKDGKAPEQLAMIAGRFNTTLRDGDLLLPPESQRAYFELVLPEAMLDRSFVSINGRGRSLVILLPGTGEHGCVHRRRNLAEPLARTGIAALVLEGSFYGQRKPAKQKGSKLRRVSDLPILGMTTIEETKSLLLWLSSIVHSTFDTILMQTHRRCVLGGSMGGLHAAMAASLCPFDVGVSSWIAPPSAVPAFTHGLLSLSCNWKSLHERDDLAAIDHLLANHVKHYSSVGAQDEPASVLSTAKTAKEKQAAMAAQVKKRLAAFLSITDIENFPKPRRPDAVIFSQATEDQYIGENAQQWETLRTRWPGAQFRRVTAGHVSGLLFETESFLATIHDVLAVLRQPPMTTLSQQSPQDNP
ncbi:Aste57867_13077 [Aphanomyces stellatus]|uniref:Aste57867_13077 protein n=1 Tax=Aphanomyces stellatus TaxID=120398 RepID=A0A485KX93_9STRA|nr:hypothetical protein As57867_013029 [Aphanomyces stellatus]VFT89921.1 Aste57867_13077 [Aphanomyces stellatus]